MEEYADIKPDHPLYQKFDHIIFDRRTVQYINEDGLKESVKKLLKSNGYLILNGFPDHNSKRYYFPFQGTEKTEEEIKPYIENLTKSFSDTNFIGYCHTSLKEDLHLFHNHGDGNQKEEGVIFYFKRSKTNDI